MAPASQYATIAQFKARLGALRLVNMSAVDATEQEGDWNLLLVAASARMNDALGRARYAVPIDFAAIADGTLRAQAQAHLAVICCTIAAWNMVAALPDAPPGLKLAKTEADVWLAGLIDGTVTVAGLDRLEAAIEERAGGRIGAVVGDDPNLDRDTYDAWQSMLLGGGVI